MKNDIHSSAKIGMGTRIYPYVYIEGDVIIGKNCIIKPFVYIPDGTRIGDNVFIGMGAQLCNDRYPRVNNPDFNLEGVTIENNVSIGANVTILPGVRICEGVIVGAGITVTKDVSNNPKCICKG
jgi:UDP-2-acetamido-3-amino-2,3-dideoxy-glucuronate N-acetyltransferase